MGRPVRGRVRSATSGGEDVCTHGGSDSGAARLLSEAMCRLRKPIESARDLPGCEVRRRQCSQSWLHWREGRSPEDKFDPLSPGFE
ncbi:unnamed protein product, partial [Iphiclides podalirius]